MTNREFIDYIKVTGLLNENICEDYIKLLDSSKDYIGDYVLRLRKYRDSIKDIITLCYWLELKFKGDMGNLLEEIVNTLDACKLYFGERTAFSYFDKFEKILLTNLYKHDSEKVIREMKIILNPINVNYKGGLWGVCNTTMVSYGDRNMRHVYYTMSMYNMGNDDKIMDIGFLVCKDNDIEIVPFQKNGYEYLDPYNTLKERLYFGLEYDIIGIAAKSMDRQEEAVRKKLNMLFDY